MKYKKSAIVKIWKHTRLPFGVTLRLRIPFQICCLFVFLALLMGGCASLPPQPEPQPTPPAPTPRQPEPKPRIDRPITPSASTRIFHDFVALIAQPGDTFSSLASQYLSDPSLDWFIAEANGVVSLKPGEPLVIPLPPYGQRGVSPKGYQTVPVLSYHRFSRDKADPMTVKASVFEEQMRYLKENGYRVITMDLFFDFLNSKRPIPKKSAVITIDDNHYSIYEIAFPILMKYGYPATLFIYTDQIHSIGRGLTWNHLSEMARNGIDIQCHTKSHRNLSKRMSEESFRDYFEVTKKELAESAALIKKRLHHEVKYLAYPFGDTNSLVIALLEKLGYQGALTVERGGNPFFVHPFRINRSMIYGNFSLQDFQKSLASVSDMDSQ